MASSSYFTTSNQYIKYQIIATETATSIADNTSTVRITVIAWRTNQGYTTDGYGSCYVNVNGTNYNNSWVYGQKPIRYNSDTVLFEQTLVIPHNADGTKNIYVSASISHERFSANSQGFNVELTRIPRAATITSAPNFNDTENPVLGYNNPAGDTVTSLQACISFDGSTAAIAYRDITKTGTAYTFNLSTAERATLYNSIPNANSRTIYYIVKTVLGGNTYTATQAATFNVANAAPVVGGVYYADDNPTTVTITQNNQLIIRNNSVVLFNVSSIAAQKGASLASVKAVMNNITKSVALSGTTASNVYINYGTTASDNNLTAQITATDSRGNTATETVNVSVLSYQPPRAENIQLERKSGYYSESYLKVKSLISDLNGHNTATIQYQYKESTVQQYGSLITIADDTQITINLDNTKSYNFKIVITDRIGTITYNKNLSVGIPIIMFDRYLHSTGLNCLPTEENTAAFGGKIQAFNTYNEKTLQIEQPANTAANRGASILMNTGGTNTLKITTDDYPQILFKNRESSGNNQLTLYATQAGGQIQARNANGNYSARLLTTNQGCGQLSLYNASNSESIKLTGETGNITCVSLTQTSSIKVKENVKPLSDEESEKILLLQAVTFDYKNKVQGTNRRGFIAEDVAEIIPEITTAETETTPASIDYIQMIPYLQNIIKKQQNQINELNNRLAEIEKRL